MTNTSNHDQPTSTPPWLRGRWGAFHAWGLQNPKLYYIYPPSLWAVMIYVLSIANLKPIEVDLWIPPIPLLDKWVHMVFYAVLSLLVLRGWQREKMPPIGLHGFVFLICVVFGSMIEVHQIMTGYRSFELADILADAIGALMGQSLWHLLMVKWGKRTRLYPGLFRE